MTYLAYFIHTLYSFTWTGKHILPNTGEAIWASSVGYVQEIYDGGLWMETIGDTHFQFNPKTKEN